MDSNIFEYEHALKFVVKQGLKTDNSVILCNTTNGIIFEIPEKYAGVIPWLEPYIISFTDLCTFFDSILSGNSHIVDNKFTFSRLETLQTQISAVLFNIVCDRDWNFTDVLSWYIFRDEQYLIVRNIMQNKTVKVSVKNNRMIIVDA